MLTWICTLIKQNSCWKILILCDQVSKLFNKIINECVKLWTHNKYPMQEFNTQHTPSLTIRVWSRMWNLDEAYLNHNPLGIFNMVSNIWNMEYQHMIFFVYQSSSNQCCRLILLYTFTKHNISPLFQMTSIIYELSFVVGCFDTEQHMEIKS